MADLWYYTRNGQAMDPVPAAELKRLAASGQLKPTDLVWKEGMANWVAASAAKGLFPDAGASPLAPLPAGSSPATRAAKQRRLRETDDWDSDDADILDEEAPRLRRRREPADDDWDDDQPRRRRQRDADVDFDEERPRRRRRRRRKQQGMNPGVIIALAVGGVFVVLLLGGLAVVLAVINGEDRMEGTYHWSLNTNQKATYRIRFLAGHRVELRVNSHGQSDMDLFVFDGNAMIHRDERFDKDCFLSFVPRATKTYRVEVWNRNLEDADMRWRNGRNHGSLVFKQTDLAGAAQQNPPVKQPPIAKRPPPIAKRPPPIEPAPFVPPDAIGGRNITFNGVLFRPGMRRTHTAALTANVTYTIDLRSNAFDAYLELHDAAGQLLMEDDDSGGGLNARLIFTPNQTATYRLIVRSFDDDETGPYTLTVR